MLARCRFTVSAEMKSRPAISRLVEEHGLNDHVQFLGVLDRGSLARELSAAHCYVLPHLCGNDTASLMEAMACGLPSIVIDYGTPGEMIDDECGKALPMQSADKLVVSLREAMETAVNDHRWCRECSLGAIERVCGPYHWPTLAMRVSQIYQYVLEPDVMADTAERQLVSFVGSP